MKKIIAIVCARGSSKRLPGKNKKKINDICMVERAVKNFNSAGVKDIIVATDYSLDFDISTYGAKHINRSKNVSNDTIPLQQTVKWVYNSLDKEYEYIAFIMPNCPQLTKDDIKKALKMIENKKYNVIRSYNRMGEENGLIVVRARYLEDHFIDVYCGAIFCEGSEIHDLEDYKAIKTRMESENE
jgi:CMP-N-acetylneuraminic acid synthetase